MKDFKTKQQMTAGHYCWGGKAMKKAKGGYAEGGMRSESSEAAKAGRDAKDAKERFTDFTNEKNDLTTTQGRANSRVKTARREEELERALAAGRRNYDTKNSTGYYDMDKPAEELDASPRLMNSPTSVGKAKGGNVSKPKLASDKKKYSDRDMQGIISQAKQMAPKIIQANQARAAQAQAAAGAQRPPLGGAMPARPPMGAMPAGAMPAMKKGGKLKLRRKG